MVEVLIATPSVSHRSKIAMNITNGLIINQRGIVAASTSTTCSLGAAFDPQRKERKTPSLLFIEERIPATAKAL